MVGVNVIINHYYSINRLLLALMPKTTTNNIVDGSFGIAPTRHCNHFLKIDAWSPRVGFILIISTKGINQIKKGNCNIFFMDTKRYITFLKIWCNLYVWVQFHVYHCWYLVEERLNWYRGGERKEKLGKMKIL